MYHSRHQGVKRGIALLTLLALLAVFPLSSSLISLEDRDAEAAPTADVTVTDSLGSADLVGVVGDVIVVDWTVANVFDVSDGLGSYDIQMNYDKAVVNVTAVADGDAPFGGPSTSTINNATGVVTASGAHTEDPGPTIDTVVLRVEVTAVGLGNSALSLVLTTSSVVDAKGGNITATAIDGTFTVSVPPVVTLTPDTGLVTAITGTGFTPATALTILFDAIDVSGVVVGDTVTDGAGDFTSFIIAPDQTAGAHTVTVTAGLTDNATFTVPDFQGVDGVDGVAGAKGKEGDEGDEGDAGPPGKDGIIGVDGAPGPPGLPGPSGIAGAPGPAGSSGPAGADGGTGPAGPRGATGPAGTDGVIGVDGAPGPGGPTGPTGSAGAKGDDGGGGGLGIVGLVLGIVGTAGAALALSYTFGLLRRPGA